MEDVVYSKDIVEGMPTGSFIQEQIESLRDENERLEAERDIMLTMLHGIADAEDREELEEILNSIKEYVQDKVYPLY